MSATAPTDNRDRLFLTVRDLIAALRSLPEDMLVTDDYDGMCRLLTGAAVSEEFISFDDVDMRSARVLVLRA